MNPQRRAALLLKVEPQQLSSLPGGTTTLPAAAAAAAAAAATITTATSTPRPLPQTPFTRALDSLSTEDAQDDFVKMLLDIPEPNRPQTDDAYTQLLDIFAQGRDKIAAYFTAYPKQTGETKAQAIVLCSDSEDNHCGGDDEDEDDDDDDDEDEDPSIAALFTGPGPQHYAMDMVVELAPPLPLAPPPLPLVTTQPPSTFAAAATAAATAAAAAVLEAMTANMDHYISEDDPEFSSPGPSEDEDESDSEGSSFCDNEDEFQELLLERQELRRELQQYPHDYIAVIVPSSSHADSIVAAVAPPPLPTKDKEDKEEKLELEPESESEPELAEPELAEPEPAEPEPESESESEASRVPGEELDSEDAASDVDLEDQQDADMADLHNVRIRDAKVAYASGVIAATSENEPLPQQQEEQQEENDDAILEQQRHHLDLANEESVPEDEDDDDEPMSQADTPPPLLLPATANATVAPPKPNKRKRPQPRRNTVAGYYMSQAKEWTPPSPKKPRPGRRNKQSSSQQPQQDKNQKKKRRLKPGVKALREIRKYQKSVEFLVPKMAIGRVIREILQNMNKNYRLTKDALLALQTVVETYLVECFEATILCTLHAKRVTATAADMQLAVRIATSFRPSVAASSAPPPPFSFLAAVPAPPRL